MTYAVGYSPHKDDTCALELACELARSNADAVHAITIVPRGWEATTASQHDKDFVLWARAEGEASAAEAVDALGRHPDIDGTASWVAARSVPAALLDQARRLDASILVVGSGRHGAVGRVAVTSKTDRLLHSSEIPVAIAPRGYRPAPQSRIARVTLGFRDDDATWRLLERVADMCRGIAARIRLVTVVIRHRSMVQAGISGAENLVFEELSTAATAGQREAMAHLVESGFAESELEAVVAQGRSWEDALEGVRWSAGDILVVGSSSTHPLSTVFLGSSAAKIVRAASVPVIVVP